MQGEPAARRVRRVIRVSVLAVAIVVALADMRAAAMRGAVIASKLNQMARIQETAGAPEPVRVYRG